MAGRAREMEHGGIAERAARGRAVRGDLPRSAHADWNPAADRVDPVALLEEQAATRLADFVPIRYGRMLASPFAFYRGAAYVMAADLGSGARTDIRTQLCGDAHLSNFGAFAAPDRRLVFSINDFDETLPGPFEWDVKRLVASFAVAGRERGFDVDTRQAINLRVVRSYRESMRQLAELPDLDLWYARVDVDEVVRKSRKELGANQYKQLQAGVAKARTRDSMKALGKLTEIVDGKPRIVADPPLIIPIEEMVGQGGDKLDEFLQRVVRSYRRTLPGERRRLLDRFRYADAAHKIVGVGSVGTRAFILLLLGRNDDEPLFLQIKEAQRSVLEPFLGQSEFATHGQRVVEGQRLMQAASDITLGWLTATGVYGDKRDYYVRQLWDWKGSISIETMSVKGLATYAQLCGSELARAHARAGDAVMISSYLGTSDVFDRALAGFAEAYADQNALDYAALQEAFASGRVAAQEGL